KSLEPGVATGPIWESAKTIAAPAMDRPLTREPAARKVSFANAVGALLGAIAASSCCILPLMLFSLGVGGAWIGLLTAVEPYQPIFIIAGLGFVAAGHYAVYRNRRLVCTEDGSCTRPIAIRSIRLALWTATILLAAAVAFPYVVPALLKV